ncbi:Hypp488 [Branchiostoma lanceolatum]|uniref:Hypp488 protein n=1 Tax=Branchiostoma lanceolatum TaxID=7740 RepID=A0A8J9VA78_BRALA|nr:Hypp488 [Branchiostoma lanceolatum]
MGNSAGAKSSPIYMEEPRGKVKEEPGDGKVKEEPREGKVKEEPREGKVKEEPRDGKNKEEPGEGKVKEEPREGKVKEEPRECKIKDSLPPSKDKTMKTEKKEKAQPTTVDNMLNLLDKLHRVYDVKVMSSHSADKEPPSAPDTITLKKTSGGMQQLKVGQHVMSTWNWDKSANKLIWEDGEHAGHIAFPHEESVRGYGTMSLGQTNFSVTATLRPVTYKCTISSNAGAYVKQEGSALKLIWDNSSDTWKDATWDDDVLSFTYGLEEQFFIGQKTYKITVNFEDLQTSVTYNPAEGDFSFVLTPEFQAVFQHENDVVPVPENPREDGKHVFPYLLQFTFNAEASTFTGAMLTKALDAATGEVYGVKAYVQEHEEHLLGAPRQIPLNGQELLNMSQFKKDDSGRWYDAFQQKSMNDFYTILQYYMDGDLRKKYMGMNNAPDLDPTIKQIADTNGSPSTEQQENGDDGIAKDWYKTLSVAYLAQALPNVWKSDDYAGKLNAIRAKKWLKTETSIASVFNAQSPELYKTHWLQDMPRMGQFLVDQMQNRARYASYIAQDKSSWIEEVESTVEDAANQASMLAIIESLTALGEQGKYWAYWFFRDVTQPSALSMLQMLSVGGAASLDGSAFSRQIQQNCAILGILDDSAVFQEQYVKIIQIFQLTNILPQLIDFSGDMTNYQYAVNEILTGFKEKYIDSTDPKMQEAAKEIQEKLNQKNLEDLLSQFQKMASQFTGDYNFVKLMTYVDNEYAKGSLYLLGKLVASAAVCGGIMLFYFGVKNWKSLDGAKKAQVVSDGILVFTGVAAGLVKRGVSLYEIFGTEAMEYKNVAKIAFEGECQESITRASNGFSKWILGKKGGEIEMGADAAAATEEAVVAGEEDMALVESLFGKNLDEFMATRFGASLAVLGLVFGSISLSKSKTKLEIAGNSMGVLASTMQICSTFGSWLIPEGAEIAGVECAAICSCLGALAVAAALVGVVLLIVELHKKTPSPLEDFAKNQANNAGLYMPHGADIDSFQSYQPTGQLEKEGISLQMNGSVDQYLQFNTDGSLSLTQATNGPDTVFFMTTDSFGRAKFIANLPNDDNTAIVSKYLTVDETGQLSGATQLTGDSVSQQQWVAECQGSVQRDADGHLKSASFKFYSLSMFKAQDKKYYLGGSGSVAETSEQDQPSWTVSMNSTKPVGLSMENVTLFTFQMDQKLTPTLLNPGSDPRTWHIRPDLPGFMQLDTATGAISQKAGVAPKITASNTYTLTVENDLGSASAKFIFKVGEYPDGA